MNNNLIFPEDFNYSCNSCGRCCKDWNINIDQKTYEKLKDTEFYKKIINEADFKNPIQIDESDGSLSALRKSDNICIFLDKNTQCRIHKELGSEFKPLACRQFPFKIKPAPDGIYIGVSFYCESCQKNEGKPLDFYSEDIKSWFAEHKYESVPEIGISLEKDIIISWHGYLEIEKFIRSAMRNGNANLEESLRTVLARLCLLVLNAKIRGQNFLKNDEIRSSIQIASNTPILIGDMLQQLGLFFTLAVVGVIESEIPEKARANTESVLNGGVLESDVFGKDISMKDFARFYNNNPCNWKSEYLMRYIEHLIFRKFLLSKEPILYNLAALYTAYNLADFYMYLSSYQDGRDKPEISDLYFAYSIVEKSFVSHTRIMVPFFKAFSDGFTEQLKVSEGKNQ